MLCDYQAEETDETDESEQAILGVFQQIFPILGDE